MIRSQPVFKSREYLIKPGCRKLSQQETTLLFNEIQIETRLDYVKPNERTWRFWLIPDGFQICQLPEEDANYCEVMDSKGEAAHQRRERYWCRWERFVRDWGLGNDAYLDTVPQHSERLLLARGFVMHHRTFEFDRSGKASHKRQKPVVQTTLRDAVSSVAAAFRERYRESPFHVQDGVLGPKSLHPKIKNLLRGFDSTDPPMKKQKAVNPELIRDLVTLWGSAQTGIRHTAYLIVGADFFAMRACEFCKTEQPGKTQVLTTGNVVFRDEHGKVIPHDDKSLIEKSEFVTVCFVNQKNGEKMERRSQKKTGVTPLCPVQAWGEVILQLVKDFPSEDERHNTPVCRYKQFGETREVTANDVKNLLRATCESGEGGDKYGMRPEELGTRSIRSGAAMALAVQGGQSDSKIMTLGRWKSNAFLKYIRPQTLEWAGSTSVEMANASTFLDLSGVAEESCTPDQAIKTAGSSPNPARSKKEQRTWASLTFEKNGEGLEVVQPRQSRNWPGILANTKRTSSQH